MKKQRRRKKQRHRVLKTVVGISICLAVVIGVIAFNWTGIQLGIKGYDRDDRATLLALSEEEIQEYLSLDEIIDLAKWDQVNNQHHYYDYELYSSDNGSVEDVVSYVDEFYSNYHTKLKELGYDLETQRSLMKQLSLDDFGVLADNQLEWNQVEPYLSINGRLIEDLPQYIQSGLEPVEAVMNISYSIIDSRNSSDRKYVLEDPSNTALLIKKGFSISKDYVPENLVEVNIPTATTNNKMRSDAAKALETMYEDAKKEGLTLAVNSAYRSYEEQQKIYDEYFRIYDEVTAASLVAVPGTSEHQLGLSVDLTSQSVIDGQYGVFGSTPEYQWVIKNAYKYGFILRYPSDKIDITGIANEPWHYRYVGVKLATKLYEEGLTLEEYTLQNGFDYPVSLMEN
ncbi:MAG TPA: M15 family metallopeptidase [Candidatus Scybalomonas excrementigallinarum]|nr:M15 family metallopeptidase [Candidatus Scybalomonas excrementigallinarum]